MHLWRYWIVVGLLAAFAARAAVIYKWTDAEGVVHFSDQAMPGAERIVTSSGSANGIGTGAPTPSAGSTAAKKPASGGLHFTEFSIDSPAAEQVFFGDDTIPVHLRLAPGMNENETITWHLNGRQLTDQGTDSTSFTLPSQARGSYVLAATVTDQKTGEAQTTDSITFYMRQPSELSPQHRRQ